VEHAEQLAADQEGTPSSEWMPLSRTTGLTMSDRSTCSIVAGWRVAAMRPAKPRPSGTWAAW
jgi:hypothetical protein